MGKKVVLGMSGGVDSSASAILLQQKGYEVIGVTMKLWGEQQTEHTIYDAKKVCETLGIAHYVFDCQKQFDTHVIQNFIQCYDNTLTPNPCVECNRYLKFGAMYQFCQEVGAEKIATGHYAKVEYSDQYNGYVLKKSDSFKKDQSYFLYGIEKEVLPHIVFPLQEYKEKEEIRQVAEQYGLQVAHKKDSQEICFIPDDDYKSFLEKNRKTPVKSGNIVLQDGTIVGKHAGLVNYTIGQRKGLGIAYSHPLYVIALKQQTNEVVVGEEQQLYTNQLYANHMNLLIEGMLEQGKTIEVEAKVRYRAVPAKAKLTLVENDFVKVDFVQPQRAITPGQSVVFYIDQDIVLGGRKNHFQRKRGIKKSPSVCRWKGDFHKYEINSISYL